MKKNVLIIFIVILVVLIVAAVFFVYNQKPKIPSQNLPQDLSKVSDSQIISILNKNLDAKDYMQSYPDFKINNKEILTRDSIIAGRNGQNFKEVYQGLELQDNRYMRVDLINYAGDKGLITVVDFKTDTAIKAYGLLLVKATQAQVQNGQIPIPAK